MKISYLLLVGIGGFLGSIARYLSVKNIDEKLNSIFPFGTMTVNILGSFLLGFLYGLITRKVGMTENWRLFLGTGFCGGFTTFSAFAFENINLLHEKPGISFAYIIVSITAGIGAVSLGIWSTRFL